MKSITYETPNSFLWVRSVMAIYDSESSLKPSTVLKGKEPNAKDPFSLFYLSYGSKSGDTGTTVFFSTTQILEGLKILAFF